jgi:hypothetical protein
VSGGGSILDEAMVVRRNKIFKCSIKGGYLKKSFDVESIAINFSSVVLDIKNNILGEILLLSKKELPSF